MHAIAYSGLPFLIGPAVFISEHPSVRDCLLTSKDESVLFQVIPDNSPGSWSEVSRIADIPLPFDNVRKEISLKKNLILRSKPSANVQPEYRMFVLVAPA